jgi:hypothetical protein
MPARILQRPLLLLALVFGAAHAPSAWGWGQRGHHIVADIAGAHLSPAAAAEVAALLDAESATPALRAVSTWADEIRATETYGLTAPLHFLNFPRDSCTYVPARDCFQGRCVVGALEDNAARLADRGRSDAERAEALKWIVHLVGDVHQPLHAGYRDDRGGNDVQLRFRGEGTNLHALLDFGVIDTRELSARRYSRYLQDAVPQPEASATAWSAEAPRRWAEASCGIVPSVYPRGRRIDDAYVARMLPVLDRQLLIAGHRLAALLNAVLGPH